MEDGEDTTEYAKVRAKMCWHFRRHWNVLNTADQFFTDHEASAAQFHCIEFLKTYQYLAYWCSCEGWCLWKLRPKAHYIYHAALEYTIYFENPVHLDCLNWEDFVGKVKRIASKCHRSTLSREVCLRYNLFLIIRWRSRLIS